MLAPQTQMFAYQKNAKSKREGPALTLAKASFTLSASIHHTTQLLQLAPAYIREAMSSSSSRYQAAPSHEQAPAAHAHTATEDNAQPVIVNNALDNSHHY
jgi:hypothetical protein